MTNYERGRAAGLAEAAKVVRDYQDIANDGSWSVGKRKPNDTRGLALAFEIEALSTSPSNHVLVPKDCRQWQHYVTPMPVNAEGNGPATIGEDAVKIEYEVWEADLCTTIGSYEFLPDAINRAISEEATNAHP